MVTHTSAFGFLACVHIDGDESVIGTVTCVAFRSGRSPLYEVSWLHNGSQQQYWIEEGRLDSAEDDLPATRRKVKP